MAKKRMIGLIKWRMIGKGVFYIGKRPIPNGMIFSATPEQIPESFRDIVVPLDPVKAIQNDKSKKVPKKVAPIVFKLKERDDDLWDVVNGKGKAMNEDPLSKAEAEALRKELKKK